MGRSVIVHENFLRRVAARDFPAGQPPLGPLTPEDAVAAYRAACTSLVFHHDRLAELIAERSGEQSRCCVRGSARRESDD